VAEKPLIKSPEISTTTNSRAFQTLNLKAGSGSPIQTLDQHLNLNKVMSTAPTLTVGYSSSATDTGEVSLSSGTVFKLCSSGSSRTYPSCVEAQVALIDGNEDFTIKKVVHRGSLVPQ
jgi:hypothetical protein